MTLSEITRDYKPGMRFTCPGLIQTFVRITDDGRYQVVFDDRFFGFLTITVVEILREDWEFIK